MSLNNNNIDMDPAYMEHNDPGQMKPTPSVMNRRNAGSLNVMRQGETEEMMAPKLFGK